MPDITTNEDQKPERHSRQGTITEKDKTHPTTYLEAITHIFKGNVGPGLFAMGDAFKNGGIIAGTLLTLAIAVICVHCEHILVECSKKMSDLYPSDENADYAETVEQCFLYGPMRLRRFSYKMRQTVNIFICVTQLGFCCVYFVFISQNFEQIFAHYNINLNIHIVMSIALIPVLLPSLLTKLKLLAPVSHMANFCMISGLIVTMYFALKDGFPDINERNFMTNARQLALYFGTTIFAFEGIALVLPIKLSMKNKYYFDSYFGVLNVGMTGVTFSFIIAGFLGYWKWGENVDGSLTLNVDVTSWLGQYVKIAVSIGVLFGYPLQFFVAIQIMWPALQDLINYHKHPVCGELIFRFIMVMVTFGIAQFVPRLNLFISLIGALCSTALALVFPPLMEMICLSKMSDRAGVIISIKNFLILIIALLGFTVGSYESITQIVKGFQ